MEQIIKTVRDLWPGSGPYFLPNSSETILLA